MAARVYGQRNGFGWITDHAGESREALRLARAAAVCGWDDAVALSAAGFACILFGACDDGGAYVDRALEISPNLAGTWHLSGLAKALKGDVELVEEAGLRALRLSPQDPQSFTMHATVALGRLLTGREAAAWTAAEAALRAKPNALFAAVTAVASAARAADAAWAMEHLRQIAPDYRISSIRYILDFRRDVDFNLLADALRKAGVPE